MKTFKYFILLALAWSSISSCDPIEDREEMGPAFAPGDIQFSVTQQDGYDNKVFFENRTKGGIAFWDYGSGTSTRDRDTVVLPFAGEHTIKFTAFGRAGSLSDSTKITVTENDSEFFADPEWQWLTNGIEGKTWVLDMASPIGWAGLDYPGESGDNWHWFPTYAEASWSMENKDWGEMTFNLDGNFNVSVKQTALASNAQTTKKGTFLLDIQNKRMKLFGPDILIGGDYYPDVSVWNDVVLLELTETSLRFMVIRDKDRDGEGKAFIMFHYKPKS